MAKHLSLTFYEDLKAQSDLRRMAVVHSVVAIPFSRIDLKESQVNGARLNDAIRVHKVEDYMQGFRNGDTFPRPIVYKSPSGYVILSGNQRCEAIRRLIEGGELPKSVEIEVYLVETTDKLLLEIIARSANSTHGEGDTKEERLQHAVYCVQRLGMASKDAAKAFTVADNSINHHIRAEQVRKQLQRSGVDAHRVPTSVLEPISRLKFDESAQLKIGTLVAQHAPTAERVRQVTKAVKTQTTAQGRAGVIKEFERDLTIAAHARNGHVKNGDATNSKVPLRPRRDKIMSLLSRTVAFLEVENGGEPFSNLEQLQIVTQPDHDRIVDLSKRLRYRLGVIAK